MKFTPLASSSRGNAYLLQADGTHPLLLEAGLPIRQLRDKLRVYGVSLSDLAGCLVSHEHGDHSKGVDDLLKAGVDVWMSEATAIALGSIGHHRLHTVKNEAFTIEDKWICLSFELEHDAADPKGFLIAFGGEILLFIPDTAYVKNRFERVTIIAIECNNIAEIVSKNILEGHIPAVVGKRVRRNHMSLENLITMLKANDLSQCREIWLLHLSDGNSDEQRMIKEVQEATGIPVHIAGG